MCNITLGGLFNVIGASCHPKTGIIRMNSLYNSKVAFCIVITLVHDKGREKEVVRERRSCICNGPTLLRMLGIALYERKAA